MLGMSMAIWQNSALRAEPTPPGTPAVWHTAYDTTYATLNSDGSGGAPVAGSKFGRLVDRSGNGYHATQATSGNQMYWQSGFASVAQGNHNGDRGYMQTASAGYGGTTQSVTGLIIVDTSAFPTDMIPFTFSAGAESSAAWPCRRVYVAYRGNASTLEFWINGVQYSRAAIASTALSVLNVGTSASTAFQHRRFYESILYTSALNDTDFALLRAYGATRAGSSSVGSDVLLFVGDSRTYGFNTIASSPPARQTDRLPTYRIYNGGMGGTTAQTQSSTANLSANIQKYVSAGRNVVVVWYGTNDLFLGRTPAQCEADIATICRTYQRSGFTVILCSEIHRSTTVSNATIDSLNSLLSANYTSYADRYCNLIARSELQNPANTTYFADGLHLTDAGAAVVTAEVSAAINAVDADFTQSALSVVSGQSITFTDATINGPTAWSWDVDGGGVDSTTQNPTIVFNTPGTFNPTLTATNANGSTSRTRAGYIIVVSSLSLPTSNLVLRFNKGDASGATWTDSSGLGRDMTLFNSPAITGGRVAFNGSNQYGKTASYATNRPVFIMMRMRLVAWANQKAIIDGDTDLSWLLYSNGTTPNIGFYPGSGPHAQNTGLTIGTFSTVTVGNKLNGIQVATKVGNTESVTYVTVPAAATGLTIGRQGGSSAWFCNMEVDAIAGWSVVPSDAEIAQAAAYMDAQ